MKFDFSNYRVVCDTNASAYLLGAAKWLSEKLGCQGGDKLISVMTCKCVVGWCITKTDEYFSICGESETMTVNAVYEFCQNPIPSQNDGLMYRQDGWSIAAPAYDGGNLCRVVYNDG